MSNYLKNIFANPFFTSIFWGIVGGLALIIIPTITTNGPKQASPLAFVLVASVLSMALADKTNFTFKKLFFTGLFTFLIMTLFFYLNGLLFTNTAIRSLDFSWHLCWWLFVIVLALASSFLVSIIIHKIFMLHKPALK